MLIRMAFGVGQVHKVKKFDNRLRKDMVEFLEEFEQYCDQNFRGDDLCKIAKCELCKLPRTNL